MYQKARHQNVKKVCSENNTSPSMILLCKIIFDQKNSVSESVKRNTSEKSEPRRSVVNASRHRITTYNMFPRNETMS